MLNVAGREVADCGETDQISRLGSVRGLRADLVVA